MEFGDRLPARPAQHAKETASERAFNSLLPDDWISHRPTSDYGVDLRVEIFEGGRATGLGFVVQLKSTDKKFPAAYREPIDVTTLNYLRSQAEPALLVRYHRPSATLYAFWLHARDLIPKTASQRSVSVRWRPTDKIAAATFPDRALREIKAVRALMGATLISPAVLVVAAAEPQAEILKANLQAKFSSKNVPLLASVPRRNAPSPIAPVVLTVGARHIKVDAGVTSLTISDLDVERSITEMVDGCLIALGICLGRVWPADTCVDLIELARRDSGLLRDFRVMAEVLHILCQAERWTTLARFISDEGLLESTYGLEPVVLVEAVMRRIEPVDALAIGLALKARSTLLAAADRASDAARVAQAAGNFLFHQANAWREAVDAFDQALVCDPDYAERAYFLRECGASAFEAGAYADAVLWYESALAIDDSEPMLHLVLGDAMVHVGDHIEGLKEIERGLDLAHAAPAIWRLKRRALGWIIENADRAGSADADGTSVELLSEGMETLELMLVGIAFGQDDLGPQGTAHLAASLLAAGHPSSEDILSAMAERLGRNLVPHLTTALEALDLTPRQLTSLLARIADADSLRREDRAITQRLYQPDGTYSEVTIIP